MTKATRPARVMPSLSAAEAEAEEEEREDEADGREVVEDDVDMRPGGGRAHIGRRQAKFAVVIDVPAYPGGGGHQHQGDALPEPSTAFSAAAGTLGLCCPRHSATQAVSPDRTTAAIAASDHR